MSVAASGRVIPPHRRRRIRERSDGRLPTSSTACTTPELWLHLGWTDIKQRYRRSVLGPLWITVATGVTAVAMGIPYGTLFGFDIKDFLPYVILGSSSGTSSRTPSSTARSSSPPTKG